jgi:hypothetical protein
MLKRGTHAPTEKTPSPATGEKAFWSTAETPAPGTMEYKRRLSEHISRLQERQQELVKHTADELESLKLELERGDDSQEKVAAATQPLLSEIEALKAQNAALEETLRIAEETYRARYAQVHATVSSLKSAVESKAEAMDGYLRAYSIEAGQGIREMIASVEAAEIPTFESGTVRVEPVPTPILEPLRVNPEPPKKERVVIQKPKARVHLRRLAVRAVAFALVAAIGTGGWKVMAAIKSPSITTGSVAGVSSQPLADVAPPADTYAQSYAKIAFADTQWATLTDAGFGISVDYMSNASNKVRNIDGGNLWILREDHYLLSVTQNDATTLAAWQSANPDTVSQYTSVQGTFKGLPALVMTPIENNQHAGTLYVVARPGVGTLAIWFKNVDPASEEGQWVAHIQSSFSFTNSVNAPQPTASASSSKKK